MDWRYDTLLHQMVEQWLFFRKYFLKSYSQSSFFRCWGFTHTFHWCFQSGLWLVTFLSYARNVSVFQLKTAFISLWKGKKFHSCAVRGKITSNEQRSAGTLQTYEEASRSFFNHISQSFHCIFEYHSMLYWQMFISYFSRKSSKWFMWTRKHLAISRGPYELTSGIRSSTLFMFVSILRWWGRKINPSSILNILG